MKRTAFAAVAFGVGLAAVAATAMAAAPAATTTDAPAAPAKAAKPAAAKPAKAAAATGTTWIGTVNQVGRDAPYAIEITLSAKAGATNYPGEHCAGKLTRVGAAGDYTFFTETITDGKFDPTSKSGCLDGSLTLRKDGATMVMTWMTSYNGKAVVAYGALDAKQP